jgi:hypothetical protein
MVTMVNFDGSNENPLQNLKIFSKNYFKMMTLESRILDMIGSRNKDYCRYKNLNIIRDRFILFEMYLVMCVLKIGLKNIVVLNLINPFQSNKIA